MPRRRAADKGAGKIFCHTRRACYDASMTLAQAVRARRGDLSFADASTACGVPSSTLFRIEHGAPAGRSAARLAAWLGWTEAQVMGDAPAPLSPLERLREAVEVEEGADGWRVAWRGAEGRGSSWEGAAVGLLLALIGGEG